MMAGSWIALDDFVLGLIYAAFALAYFIVAWVLLDHTFYKFRRHHLGKQAARQATFIALLIVVLNGALHAFKVAFPETLPFGRYVAILVAMNVCIGAIALALLLRHAVAKQTVAFWSNLPIFCGPAWGVFLTEHEMSMLFEHYLVPAIK
jgi:protein-S-isoprenylcysteine O-methyltransferase Ste14